MNILFVSSDNDIYHGAFLSMVKLAETMQKEFHNSVKIVLPYEGNGTDLIKRIGIPYSMIQSDDWIVDIGREKKIKTIIKELIRCFWNIKAIKEIEKLIVSEEIDIVHVNTTWCYVGGIAAINRKCKLVWHIREFLEEDQNVTIWEKKSGYKLINRADRIIAISNSIKAKYDSVFDPKKITVILNGIDPGKYLNLSHEIMCNSTLRFLIIGNVIEGKRQKEIVQACVKLHNTALDKFILEIVGDNASEYACELRDYVVSNGASEYIFFRGKQERPEAFYQEADITFMCSVAEAFGRVTVEAMLEGSLVIGARCAGTQEIIKENENGLMYESGNVEDLYEKILYAISHKQQMKALARFGRQDMLERMTAFNNAQSINELYIELMRRKSEG